MARKLILMLLASVLFTGCQLGSERKMCCETGQWQSLFDGQTLNGWRAGENKGTFTVRDGMIVIDGKRSHLYYVGPVENADFKNFEFKADVMTRRGANSGMYFHTAYQEIGWPSTGYEVQVNNTHSDWRRTGGLYGVKDVRSSPAKDNEWFTEHIIVQDKRIIIRVNGKTIVDYTEPENVSYPKFPGRKISRGTFALQGHDPKSVVYYKNIMVKPLPSKPAGKIKAVVVTGGHNFEHEPFFSLFEGYDDIEYVEAEQKDHSEIFEDISDWDYDVIVLYNMTQNISPRRRGNFIELLNRGVGLVALHHTMGSFQTWGEYRKIIGGKYYLKPKPGDSVQRQGSTFKHDVDINVHIADATHPITRGMSDFVVHDETYKNCGFEKDNHVLLTSDHPTSDKSIGWVRRYGKARVFCIQLGHGHSIYTDPNYRRLVARAIRWTAGQVEFEKSDKSSKSKGSKPLVFHVAGDGSAMYTSIQEAINAAGAGAVIRIGPGVYEEHVNIDKPLTLEGAGWHQSIIKTKSKAPDMFEESLRVLAARIQAAKSDEQRKTIRAEFKAEFKKKFGKATVLVTDTQGVIIRNLKVTSPGKHIEGRLMMASIVRFSNAKAVVSGCAVIGCPGNGIHVINGSDVEIHDSFVAAVWNTGIVVGENGGASSRTRILNSDVRNCHYAGILIRPGSDSTTIERCRISGAAWHGIRYDSASPIIVGNLIFDNARCGIYASGKTAATIKQNVFYGNEMTGMSCWSQNRDAIEGNTFASNKRCGLEVLGASKPIVRKNIFYDNPRGVFCGDITSDSAFARSDGIVTLEANLFWDNERKAVWRTEKLSLGEETHNVEADPLFTSVEGKDFSLRADSPARQLRIGVADSIEFKSSWPLQREEITIIPEGQTRDSRKWKKQAQTTPQAKKTDVQVEKQ